MASIRSRLWRERRDVQGEAAEQRRAEGKAYAAVVSFNTSGANDRVSETVDLMIADDHLFGPSPAGWVGGDPEEIRNSHERNVAAVLAQMGTTPSADRAVMEIVERVRRSCVVQNVAHASPLALVRKFNSSLALIETDARLKGETVDWTTTTLEIRRTTGDAATLAVTVRMRDDDGMPLAEDDEDEYEDDEEIR